MGGTGDGGGVWPLADNRPVPFPLAGVPTTIKDLVGRKFRAVRHGEAATTDIDPGRITVLLDENERILNLYIDPDVPLSTLGSGGVDSGG